MLPSNPNQIDFRGWKDPKRPNIMRPDLDRPESSDAGIRVESINAFFSA